MKLSELKQLVDDALATNGDIPVVENNDYWMLAIEPRHDSFKVGIPSEAVLGEKYWTPCFILEVGC